MGARILNLLIILIVLAIMLTPGPDLRQASPHLPGDFFYFILVVFSYWLLCLLPLLLNR
jgi:hypothetical protein